MHTCTKTQRKFRIPTCDISFYVDSQTINLTTRRLELKAAIADKIVRNEACRHLDKTDIMNMHPRDFDNESKAAQTFQSWFYSMNIRNMLVRFSFLQRELRSFATSNAMTAVSDELLRTYESDIRIRRHHLNTRNAQVEQYVSETRHSMALDLALQMDTPERLAETKERLSIEFIFRQFPEIDVFSELWLRRFVDLELTEQAKQIMATWANFIVRWALQGERWWHADQDGLSQEDDVAMRDREREARDLDEMRFEDEVMQQIRSHEIAMERKIINRETKLMRWEDQHARAIRDRVMFCRFFDNMSTRSDLMTVARSRFERGLGIDNGDEIREERRAREAMELEEMTIADREMRDFLERERKRMQAERARQQAELERLRRERMRSRMYAIVMRQRELDRQRLEDRDGLTYAEREQVEREGMQIQDKFSKGLRIHVKNLEMVAEEQKRANRLKDLERRKVKEIERERVESALRERLASRRFEAAERIRMGEEDVESRMFEVVIERIISERRRFEELIAPHEPFYENDDDDDDTVVVDIPETKIIRVGGLRPGQEWLKYLNCESKNGQVEVIPTRISSVNRNDKEIEYEENITQRVPLSRQKRDLVQNSRVSKKTSAKEPFFRGHFGLVGTKKSICTSPIVRKETAPRRKQYKSTTRHVVKHHVVRHHRAVKEKTSVRRAVLNNEDEEGRRTALQQQLCKWGDDVVDTLNV